MSAGLAFVLGLLTMAIIWWMFSGDEDPFEDVTDEDDPPPDFYGVPDDRTD